jgi:hypothetical protein
MNTSVTVLALRPVFLTEDEAVALLEICLFSQGGDDPVRAEALRKISDLCREFFRGGSLDGLISPLEEFGAGCDDTLSHEIEPLAVFA